MKQHKDNEQQSDSVVLRTIQVPLRLTFWQGEIKTGEHDLLMPIPLTKTTLDGLEMIGNLQHISRDEAVFLLAQEAVRKHTEALRQGRKAPGVRCEAVLVGKVIWE